MSTEQRRITLTETADGRWTAREETAGVTAWGETKEAALAALDDAEGDRE
jgi:predicted RNase H-like HicB family nuclease